MKSDTVPNANESTVFMIVERLTGYYILILIDVKTVKGIGNAIEQLHQQYNEHFSNAQSQRIMKVNLQPLVNSKDILSNHILPVDDTCKLAFKSAFT